MCNVFLNWRFKYGRTIIKLPVPTRYLTATKLQRSDSQQFFRSPPSCTAKSSLHISVQSFADHKSNTVISCPGPFDFKSLPWVVWCRRNTWRSPVHEKRSQICSWFLVPTLSSVMQEEHVAESSPLVGSSKNMTGGLLTNSGRIFRKF